jgi:hypothetical protein
VATLTVGMARVVAATLGIALVVIAESALRLAGFEYAPDAPFQFIGNDATGAGPDGAPFVRDARRFWRLKPGAQTVEDQHDGTTINKAGFRGPWPAAARQPGVLRLAFLGDSSTFGVGVSFAETYPARTAARLSDRIAARMASVLTPLVAGTNGAASPPDAGPEVCHSPTERLGANARFLLRDFPAAVINAPGKEFVTRMNLEILGEHRYVLYLQPESSIEFPLVRLGARPSFRFGIGLNPDVWERETDGVEYRVTLNTATGTRHEVYRRYLDPRHKTADRRWFDESVSLSAFAGTEVKVILSTGPGPYGNADFDWSVWSGPMLVMDGPSEGSRP